MDQISGQARYTGGVPELLDGIEIVLVAVGLFAVAEVLYAPVRGTIVESAQHDEQGAHDRRDWRRSWPAWLRGTAIGAPFGCIPAGGTEIPTFLSYATEKKLAKGRQGRVRHPGAIEGVAGPEAANNATVTAALIPLLTLGIPPPTPRRSCWARSRTTASSPGPQLFTDLGGAGLGADRVAVHRQRDAAGAEPAAGGPVGQAAEDPQAPAVCRHPDLRHGGRLRHAPERDCFDLVIGLHVRPWWWGLLGVVMRRF
jgi:hypothetical protein